MIGFKYQCRYVVLANIRFIQLLQQEPIVLERSAKLNKDPDRGDKGDEGDGVDRSDKGAQRREGKNSCGRAYGYVSTISPRGPKKNRKN